MKMRSPNRILTLIASAIPMVAAAAPTMDFRVEGGDLVLAMTGDPAMAQRVEQSSDAVIWSVVDAAKSVPAWETVDEVPVERRLFRAVESTPPIIAPHASWKGEVRLPNDPFFRPDLGASIHVVNWGKFVVLLDDATQVYFQDSNEYAFHFDFATERLAPFGGMSRQQFDAATLESVGRQAILGAVLVEPNAKEFAVQLVGAQPFPRETLRYIYELVASKLNPTPDWRGFIMPVPAHVAAARAEQDYFDRVGIGLAEPGRWTDQDGCYVQGWGLGRLRFFPHDQIEDAYRTGELLPTDILMTDLIPAELPFVAGIVSFGPTTPNSHVAILAESYGVPFVYLDDPFQRDAAMELVDEVVALRVGGDFFGCEAQLYDASTVPQDYRDEILALKAVPELEIAPTAMKGSFVVDDLSEVWPADIQYIGGKAANFGFLRRVVPGNSPQAIAFTFDLWEAFLDQTVDLPFDPKLLREQIDELLVEHTSWPPSDMADLDRDLQSVRLRIKQAPLFSPAQRTEILAALSGFDPNAKLRFRSSTNVEDSGVFVGAGLYDSFSGCIADDIDGDDDGPSHCDPDQPEERGVFRAMRKVFASFYNRNAYLERLRHGVDESEVGMALLVHHSFPDEIEAANGVATSDRRVFGFATNMDATMVTQLGAVSVTNPEGDAVPEVVNALVYRGNFNSESVNVRQPSSLLRLGEEAVMDWDRDYLSFADMFFDLGEAFVAHYPENTRPRLEYEYKKLTNGDLVIKQMREVPSGDHSAAPALAVIDSTTNWKLFQGETGTVMGNHRLKSLWRVNGWNRWYPPTGSTQSAIQNAEVQVVLDGQLVTESGPLETFPEQAFRDGKDEWIWTTEGGETTMALRLNGVNNFEQDPISPLSRFGVEFTADYSMPLLEFDFRNDPTTTTTDFARLVNGHVDDPLPDGSIKVVRQGSDGGVGLRVEFYWPPNPTGPTAGYTAPLEKWVGTTITGLTTAPIELVGYFSQTYRPGHHNFTEEFLFEPALEEGISAAQLAELEAANVKQIYAFLGGPPQLKIIGLDGRVRDL